ncbi:BNR repeat-containing family member [Cyclobacterium lianum]|uniref:BNR repeat-containing family member n=1 Tax=Cyclobacterium lianum TaxID=388280 RepID=A0A1M7QST9_9BACT|nr:BNR repeat-containing protein [Cyclobacterium lianum]SHN34866.1 BNR repeat-containing family member [Cyclobacterium lianum]
MEMMNRIGWIKSGREASFRFGACCLLAMLTLSFCSEKADDGPIIIDERDQGMSLKNTMAIDKVWSGHPVGFSLLTHGNRQYIAYYNEDRHMTVGQRNLEDASFERFTLPVFDREEGEGTSTILNWDSHNSVTLAVDKEGFIHLSGNMHVHPLTYFKSTKPHDISSLKQEMKMVGRNEQRCTYPKFMTSREGELIFHYRDGGSGNGNEIYNIYDTESGKWSRLLDAPLTDGRGEMNAYASQPTLREDDWYHMYWVWRDTPDCETNHDLSYIKSPDLINWYNAFEEPVRVPVTIEQQSVIVDPIPPGGGIINLAAKLCLDENQQALMGYHKYDEAGNLQFYVARARDGKWTSKQVTDWNYRWEFSGRGSIDFEVRVGTFERRDDGNYELGYQHVEYGNGTILLDKELNPIGKVLKPESYVAGLQPEDDFPGLGVRSAGDLGKSENGRTYMLKWETLARNRDRPHPEPLPAPSQLYLLELE